MKLTRTRTEDLINPTTGKREPAVAHDFDNDNRLIVWGDGTRSYLGFKQYQNVGKSYELPARAVRVRAAMDEAVKAGIEEEPAAVPATEYTATRSYSFFTYDKATGEAQFVNLIKGDVIAVTPDGHATKGGKSLGFIKEGDTATYYAIGLNSRVDAPPTPKISERIKKTIQAFGREVCVKAYLIHSVEGESGYEVACRLIPKDERGVNDAVIRMAGDRLIDAGRWLRENFT